MDHPLLIVTLVGIGIVAVVLGLSRLRPEARARELIARSDWHIEIGGDEVAEGLLRQAEESVRLVADESERRRLRYEIDRRLGALALKNDQYEEAERLLSSAVAHCDTLLAADDPETVGLLGNLALAYWEQRRDSDADAEFGRLLRYEPAEDEAARGQTAGLLHQLGMACVVRNFYRWPERLLQRSLELFDDENDPTGELRMSVLLGLAETRMVLAEYRSAWEALDAAASLMDAEDQDDTVAFLRGQGDLLDCRWADAERHLRRRLELSRLTGEDEEQNEQVALSLGELAELYRVQGRFAEGMELSTRALRMHEDCLGGEHPRLAFDLMRHSLIAVQLGEHAAADAHLSRGVELARRYNRRGNAVLGTLHLVRGILELEREQPAPAEAALREARSVAEGVYGQGHRLTMDSIMILADVLREQGQLAEAAKLLEEAEAICERHGETSPLDRVDLHTTASRARLAEGKPADAARHLQAATRLIDEHVDREHYTFAEVLFESSRLDRPGGRLGEAERKLREALVIQERVRLPSHPIIRRVRQELANILREAGREEEAVAIEEQIRPAPKPSPRE